MGNIKDKYKSIRSELKNGDIILYSADSAASHWIRYFDNAYFTHIGIIWLFGTRVFTLDMWPKGLCLVPASKRVSEHLDFAILRPTNRTDIDNAIIESLKMWEGNVKYDYFILLRIALKKKTGLDLFQFIESKKKMICSEFVQWYCQQIGIDCYNNLELITPQDFVRNKNNQLTLIYDDTPKNYVPSLF